MAPSNPVINSLLDTDFYKFTMGQVVFKDYPSVPVVYSFKNRTKEVALAKIIPEEALREQLDHVRALRFNKSELHYLRGTNEYQDRMFSEDYLDFLAELQLPDYLLERDGDTYRLEFAGPWSTAIYWETFALSVVNELNYLFMDRSASDLEKDAVRATGISKLLGKVEVLKSNPEVRFSDFGTRRRFSRDWQDYVVKNLACELPDQFLGTSNVSLAMKYGLLPMGTSAHEMYMAMSGIARKVDGDSDEAIRNSHNTVLKNWWRHYGEGLSIALTDTYGSSFFFSDMTVEQARDWKGLRQDSGDPYRFGERAIRFYREHDIDPKDKLIVFSDGLDVATIVKLSRHFKGKIKVTFGWGTNLTNDLGERPLSMVVKLSSSCGYGTVKLSDNLAKAMGRQEDINRFKKIFGYADIFDQACIY